jgi:CheY-like chemotaxis protein
MQYKSSKDGEREARPAMPRLSGKVLVAEDSDQSRRLITSQLQLAGAQVDVAEDGWIACEKVMAAVAAGEPYPLILMDMQMPELDGYSAVSVLRSKRYSGAIVALTADDRGRDRERGLDSGCDDFLVKPVDKRKLLKVAAIYLADSGAEDRVSELGIEELNPEMAGMDPALVQMLPAYIADLPAQVGRLLEMLNQQDVASLRQVLHQVKGSAGMYGFVQLTQSAAHAERELIQTQCIARTADDVRKVVELIRAVEGYDGGRGIIGAGGKRS